jgi:hypothetical protein
MSNYRCTVHNKATAAQPITTTFFYIKKGILSEVLDCLLLLALFSDFEAK